MPRFADFVERSRAQCAECENRENPTISPIVSPRGGFQAQPLEPVLSLRPIDSTAGAIGCRAPTGTPSPRSVEAARKAHSQSWQLEFRDGVLRPPAFVVFEGILMPNPVAVLGECADTQCESCRATHPEVRANFLGLCLRAMRASLDRDQSLTYVSLGSGQLYWDWHFLERLHAEGYSLKSVHLVDSEYKEAEGSVAKALKSFSGWCEECYESPVWIYTNFDDLKRGLADKELADVCMQCDTDIIGLTTSDHVAPVIRPGGLHLYLKQSVNRQCASRRTEDIEVEENTVMDHMEEFPTVSTFSRRRALREGRLYKVLSGTDSRVSRQWGAKKCGHFPRDTEVVAARDPVDGWLPLHRFQTNGPLPNGRPQWLRVAGELGHGIEQVELCSSGVYRVLRSGARVTTEREWSSSVVAQLEKGSVVKVLETYNSQGDKRLRGLVEEPPGWITLADTLANFLWVEPV